MNECNGADCQIPGYNQIVLSDELEIYLRDRYKKDRENKFLIYLSASGIRRKYLDQSTGKYAAV